MFYDYYERDYYSQKVPIILNIHNFLDIPELSKLSKAQPDIPDQPKLQKKFHLFIAQQEISRFDGYPLEFFKRFWQVISPLFNIMVKGIKLSGLTPAHGSYYTITNDRQRPHFQLQTIKSYQLWPKNNQ